MNKNNTGVRQVEEIIAYLDNIQVNTWFDIGYFLDRLKTIKPLRPITKISSKARLCEKYRKGIAFITFDLGFDGVTIEMMKYAEAIYNTLGKNTPIHWLTGEINPSIEYFQNPKTHKSIFPLMQGFEKSSQIYQALFHTKLKRGDHLYNSLPTEIWANTLSLTYNLLEYINKNNIELLVTANVSSNPGNLPLALSLVIISELYGISVVSLNHDYYWEGGSDRKLNQKKGPRDHFFANADLGEIFSLIQILYPWDSPFWIHANINTQQTDTILGNLGFNPFNVTEITSAVDIKRFRPYKSDEKHITFHKFNKWIGANAKVVDPNDKDIFDIFNNQDPVIINESHKRPVLSENSIIFLQPTRIIERKRIEKDFLFIKELLKNPELDKDKDVILIVAGPLAGGADAYGKKLLLRAQSLFKELGGHLNFSLVFLLGNDSTTQDNNSTDLNMSELYAISTLVLLPSKLETRGLPILESAAAGVPLIVSRFEPKGVYQEVLGLHLPEEERLTVFELPVNQIGKSFINNVVEIIINQNKRNDLSTHNRAVIQNRYSMKKLESDFDKIIEKLWLIKNNYQKHRTLAQSALNYVLPGPKIDHDLVFDANRTYIQGIMKYRFLSQVKSIIDPCYFRVEEKQTLSNIYSYALSKVPPEASEVKKELFFNTIRNIFSISKGHYSTELDTTFDYRYRDNTIYLWRELTEPKLFGAITFIENKIFKKLHKDRIKQEFLPKLEVLAGDKELAGQINRHRAQVMAMDIDITSNNPVDAKNYAVSELQNPMQIYDWKIFAKRILDQPQQLVIFPGKYEDIAWDLFMYDFIAQTWDQKSENYRLFFACRKDHYNSDITIEELQDVLDSGLYPNLFQARQRGSLSLIPAESKSASVDLMQISPQLKKALLSLKTRGGHVLSKGEHNYFSLDLLDIPSFRYGTIRSARTSAVFGMPKGTKFLQFVPAGLRPFFGFPLTLETPLQFSKALNSIYDFYNTKEMEKTLHEYKVYLDKHGMTLKNAISTLDEKREDSIPEVKRLSGKYSDGNAWTGVSAKVQTRKQDLTYHILSSKKKKNLPQFVRSLEKKSKKSVAIGWNGGYILNNELVGKLNLPEDFVGIPLGFVVSKNKVLSLPLYNHPVFGVKKSGEIIIDTLKLDFSGKILKGQKVIFSWEKSCINPLVLPSDKVAVYTPLSGLEKIPASNRILVILGGKKILKLSYPKEQSGYEPLFSAGVTFSLPVSMKDKLDSLKENMEIIYELDLPPKWADITDAIGAGPQLIKDGQEIMSLEEEGWLLDHSIKTQAARRDRENERGPRIGCGINNLGEIICVVVESRIRESVGATYSELAQILKNEGAQTAMGFDPGGSATLWANGVANIVPYSSTYNKNPLTGKPEARPVANVVLIASKEPIEE